MTTNSNPTAVETGEQWPHDLIAFKWAETLSQGEQSLLLAGNIKRLQERINAALHQREQEVRESCAQVVDICTCGSGPEFRSVNMRYHQPSCVKYLATLIRAAAIRRDDTPQEGEQSNGK